MLHACHLFPPYIPFQLNFNSVPNSPFIYRGSGKKKPCLHNAEKQPLVTPYLEIALPYVDDSNAVTPDDLYNNEKLMQLLSKVRRHSNASLGLGQPSSRRGSYASLLSRASRGSVRSKSSPKAQTKFDQLLQKREHNSLMPDDYQNKDDVSYSGMTQKLNVTHTRNRF